MTQRNSRDCVQIDVPLVARLVADQFPQWAELTIQPAQFDGHDNRTFRLGEEMSVRVPSARQYAAHVETEQKWLPKLARHLPLPIPVPLALGKSAPGLPWHWSINTWLEGKHASAERIDDPVQFAGDLARFLNTLQRIDTTSAPPPGPDNFYRGGPLAVYDGETRQCIRELHDTIDTQAATAVWEAALETTWQAAPVWIHGDVAAGNLLVKEGRLCGVIDFGQLAAGDPACDVTIAWTLLAGDSRQTFRKMISVDEAAWARGRGWGLWKALLELRTHRASDPARAERSQRVIDAILAD